tara:strand:- start:63 stop:722 length:660 start_codon:yes stop_codon:yes gene_type:complete
MRTALVTGSTSGLGLQLCKTLIERKYKVYGLSRKTNNSSFSNIKHYKHIKCDLTKITSETQVSENIDDKLDIVINNAAIYLKKEFKFTEIKEISSIIDLNIKGTLHLTKSVLPFLKNTSSIIFINSVAGINSIFGESIYCCTKHAIKSFAQTLGDEFSEQGIRVMSIFPGGINTPMQNLNPKKKEFINPSLLSERIINMAEDTQIYIKDMTTLSYCEYF